MVVIDMAISEPAFGQLRVSNELKKQGIIVSPSGVRSIWLRNTARVNAALEKNRGKLETLGGITTEHPGYLVIQDTYHSIDELQMDVDSWLVQYNNNRSHFGKYCS